MNKPLDDWWCQPVCGQLPQTTMIILHCSSQACLSVRSSLLLWVKPNSGFPTWLDLKPTVQTYQFSFVSSRREASWESSLLPYALVWWPWPRASQASSFPPKTSTMSIPMSGADPNRRLEVGACQSNPALRSRNCWRAIQKAWMSLTSVALGMDKISSFAPIWPSPTLKPEVMDQVLDTDASASLYRHAQVWTSLPGIDSFENYKSLRRVALMIPTFPCIAAPWRWTRAQSVD